MRAWWSVVALGMVLGAAGVGTAQPVFVQQQRIDAPAGALDFGLAVAVEGTTMAISAPREQVNGVIVGAVYIYVRNGSQWELQQRVAGPAGLGSFGVALDLSGEMIAVGGRAASGNGIVRIYERTGTTWAFHSAVQGQQPAAGARADDFGRSVDLDGTRLIVGAPSFQTALADDVTGAAFVFDRSGTSWTMSRLTTGSQVQNGAAFGSTVSVDGDVACVCLSGGFGDLTAVGNSTRGGVAFYRRVNAIWTFQQGESGAVGNFLGSGCDVSNGIAMVGRGGGAYGARVYARTAGATSDTWAFQADVIDAGSPGNFVSLAGDTAFIGGLRVLVRDRGNNTWGPRQTLQVAGAMKSDGTTLVVGNVPSGNAWIYGPGTVPTGPPGAPSNVQASVSGNTLSVTWGAPATGGAPTAYTLLARLVAGGAIVADVPQGMATSFTTPAPNGTFVVSVRAANASGPGPESAGVTVTIPQAAPPPGPPLNLAATVSGATVSFVWTPPASGGAVGAYVLAAGLSPGFVVPFATIPLGTTPGFSVPGVPPGTYYVRVLAQNSGGTSAPSNEVAFTVAGLTPPGPPTLNAPMVSGSTVSLSWGPGSGGAPTGYTLTASLTPGGAPIVTAPFASTGASFSGVPSGTYYLRLTASNAAGTSAPSAEVTVVVP